MKLLRVSTASGIGVASLMLVACSPAAVSVEGTWGEPNDEGQPSLVFEDNGTLHGTDGCNNLVGDYEVAGAEVTFGPLASTLMYCEGVDDWLHEGYSATVDGDTLIVYDESGTEIGTLERAD